MCLKKRITKLQKFTALYFVVYIFYDSSVTITKLKKITIMVQNTKFLKAIKFHQLNYSLTSSNKKIKFITSHIIAKFRCMST